MRLVQQLAREEPWLIPAFLLFLGLATLASSVWLTHTPIQTYGTTKAEAEKTCHDLHLPPAGDLQYDHESGGNVAYYQCGNSGNRIYVNQ